MINILRTILSSFVSFTLLLSCSSLSFATKESVPLIGATKVWKMTDASGRAVTGKKIKVGIIDSGIDTTHPDFNGASIQGYDFTTNSTKLTDKEGHGTAIAGIIHKIAPDASLFVYRLSSKDTNEEHYPHRFINAMRRAISDGVDVINLSFSEKKNIPTGPMVKAVYRAIDQGIVVVTSAGNNGPLPWSVGTPATCLRAITVGASTKEVPQPAIQLAKDSKKMEVVPLQYCEPFQMDQAFPIKHIDRAAKPVDLKGSKGKVLLVERHHKMSIKDLTQRAHKAGAKALIICNPSQGELEIPISEYMCDLPLPVATLAGLHNTYVKQTLASGKKQLLFTSINKERVASFTPRGPTLGTWGMKPNVCAPGVDICSSVPKTIQESGYNTKNGTSRAAAHVTGAVALIKQAHPEWTPAEVKSALSSTAITLKNSLGHRAPYLAQGAGRIAVNQAIQVESIALPSSISFGMIPSNKEVQSVKKHLVLKNMTDKPKKYTLSGKVDTKSGKFTLKLPNSVDVKGKSKRAIPITLSFNTSQVPQGVYTGTIWAKEGNHSIKVPLILMIDAKKVPKMEGLFVEKLPKEKPSFRITYYLPVGVDKLELWMKNTSTHQDHPIHLEKKKAAKGRYTWTWEGQDTHGKPLPDGKYHLKAKYIYNGKIETIAAEWLDVRHKPIVSTIDNTPPEISVDTTQNSTIKGTVTDLYSGVKKVSWRLDSKTAWTDCTLKKKKKGKGYVFTYTFKQDECKKGKTKIMLRAMDKYGNSTTIPIYIVVTVKK